MSGRVTTFVAPSAKYGTRWAIWELADDGDPVEKFDFPTKWRASRFFDIYNRAKEVHG